MITYKRSIMMATILILCVAFIGAVYAEEQKWCPLCGMNLKMFWNTHHRLVFKDGSQLGYCSIHCASQVYEKRKDEISKWEVVDYDSKKLIDAKKAHFLIGSELPGTMTPVSKIAFVSVNVAKKYQGKHGGGTIGTFDDALQRALADRDVDKKMIMGKVQKKFKMGEELAGKHGCYKCHGVGGKGKLIAKGLSYAQTLAWNHPEFVKKMDNRVKIKEAIMRGSPGKMPSYEGKISEKELHAISVYIDLLPQLGGVYPYPGAGP